MGKAISAEQAARLIPDEASLMLCGSPPAGAPCRVVEALVARAARRLTVIVPDLADPGAGVSRLIEARCVARVVAGRLGHNPVARRRLMRAEFELELVGLERLIGRIRAAGEGLGGLLVPPGPAQGADPRPQVDLDGLSFRVERPLRAHFALLGAREADAFRNLSYARETSDLARLMARAADCVIAEAERLRLRAPLPAAAVQTSGVVVNYVVPPTAR